MSEFFEELAILAIDSVIMIATSVIVGTVLGLLGVF